MIDIYTGIEAEIPRLRRYARALTRDVAVADDLVQDCLARALGKLHLWHKGTDLRAWLFTILHNQYVNHVRRSVREGAVVGLSDNEPSLIRPAHQGQRLELRDLERAIAKLPEEQQAAILLVGLEGMRYEDVAAVLGVPVGTIRSRLSRGRETLRRLVGMEPDERASPPRPPSRAGSGAAPSPSASRKPGSRSHGGLADPARAAGAAGCVTTRRRARTAATKPQSERWAAGTNRTAHR